MYRGREDSRDFPVSAKMRLPDKNVRPIGFLKSLHSSPPIPLGRDRHGGAICSIFVNHNFRDVPLSPHMKITIPVRFEIRTILILILLSGIVGSKTLHS